MAETEKAFMAEIAARLQRVREYVERHDEDPLLWGDLLRAADTVPGPGAGASSSKAEPSIREPREGQTVRRSPRGKERK